jgi:serine/threonine-protein kinase
VQPKLLDFGIVKSAQPDGSSGPSDAGSVVGSPDYMSPEQARGLEQVDARSDSWSFSVVLYEAIAGVAPFQATSYSALLRMIVQDEPKSLKELAAADHPLSYIVARGLNKDPMARYDSLSQMGRALAAWLADRASPKTPAASRSKRSGCLVRPIRTGSGARHGCRRLAANRARASAR